MMKRVMVAVIIPLGLCTAVQADVFNMSPGLTNLETVVVGDPGNVGDPRYGKSYYGNDFPYGWYGPDDFGSVSNSFRMGKYEVTAAQYCDFLNHKAKSDPYGLYNTGMGDSTNYWRCNILRSGSSGSYSYSVPLDWANRPVNWVSFWDACRFVNWLHNGQGDGDTETGAYTLNGYKGNDGRTIKRNAGAKWFIPSEDEWYKAAYYKGGGTDAGYWDYPTQSYSKPGNKVATTDPGNSANWYDGPTIGNPYWRTEVGEFENSASAYGTFDQGGNVWEWNETVPYQDSLGGWRGRRGGHFYDSYGLLRASHRYSAYPSIDDAFVGFRVATVIPEPSSIAVLAGWLSLLLGARRRRT